MTSTKLVMTTYPLRGLRGKQTIGNSPTLTLPNSIKVIQHFTLRFGSGRAPHAGLVLKDSQTISVTHDHLTIPFSKVGMVTQQTSYTSLANLNSMLEDLGPFSIP